MNVHRLVCIIMIIIIIWERFRFRSLKPSVFGSQSIISIYRNDSKKLFNLSEVCRRWDSIELTIEKYNLKAYKI